MTIPAVATTPFCAQCGEDCASLTPYRYPNTPPNRPTPRFCKRCLPRDWARWEKRYGKANPPEPPEPYVPSRNRSEPFRTTCPPYTPVVSFVWDIPNVLHDAVSDMERHFQLGPPEWSRHAGKWVRRSQVRNADFSW